MRTDQSILSLLLLSLAGANALAQSAPAVPIDAPKWIVGDTWEYQTSPRRANSCNPSKPFNYSHSVEAIEPDGVLIGWGNRTIKLNAMYQEVQSVFGSSNLMESYAFPMVVGKTWPKTMIGMNSSNARLKTDLKCEHVKMERISVPAGEFDTMQIVCKGEWWNQTYRTSGPATYTDWYSPAVKNMVRREVVTWYDGAYCADIETVLTKFTAGATN